MSIVGLEPKWCFCGMMAGMKFINAHPVIVKTENEFDSPPVAGKG